MFYKKELFAFMIFFNVYNLFKGGDSTWIIAIKLLQFFSLCVLSSDWLTASYNIESQSKKNC